MRDFFNSKYLLLYTMQAPGRANFENVNGYFEQPVASFEEFAQRLVPSHCFCASPEKMLCSNQCQLALKILGLTDEHKKVIDCEIKRFECMARQLLRRYFTDSMTAERKLQGVLNGYFYALNSIATSADPCSREFLPEFEPIVGGPMKQHSDISVSYTHDGQPEKLCMLVELKYSHVESKYQDGFQKAFSQLIQAAALAFNAKQWDTQLCCCLGSLTHWHMFLLKVVRDRERDCPSFHISHYNMLALQNVQFYRNSTPDLANFWPEVKDLYKELLKHFLLWLLAKRFTPSNTSITD